MPTSHSLSSYSKLESLFISLAAEADEAVFDGVSPCAPGVWFGLTEADWCCCLLLTVLLFKLLSLRFTLLLLSVAWFVKTTLFWWWPLFASLRFIESMQKERKGPPLLAGPRMTIVFLR